MAPISMTNIPRPAKRKAEQNTTITDVPSKRQKTAPAPAQKPARNPRAAKASRPTQSDPAIPPTGFVDNNTVLASDYATISSPTSSVGSKQSSPILSAPHHNPGACFRQAVAAPITPWPHNFPAPTPRFAHPLSSCPVDWSRVNGVSEEQKEAYELHAPWDPSPPTFTAVKKRSQFKVSGRAPSEEGMRKRFKKACLAVFECSGVYFEDSALGLEDYGVPRPRDLKKLIVEATATALLTPASTPPLFFTISTTSGSRRRKQTRLARGDSEASIYAGEIVAVQLQTAEDDRPKLRVCDKRLLPNLHTLSEYNVTVTEYDEIHIQQQVPILPFSTNAFDRWHSSVCFGTSRTFPQREYICHEIGDGEYLLRDNGRPREDITTLGLMIETYCVSQAMGTVGASNMILREISRWLKGVAAGTMLGDEEETLLENLYADDAIFEVVGEFIGSTVDSDEIEDE